MGFYTTRFVTADNETEAIEKVMTLVRTDANPLTQPDAPWKIELAGLDEVDASMMRDVHGFTFFPDDSTD